MAGIMMNMTSQAISWPELAKGDAIIVETENSNYVLRVVDPVNRTVRVTSPHFTSEKLMQWVASLEEFLVVGIDADRILRGFRMLFLFKHDDGGTHWLKTSRVRHLYLTMTGPS